MKLTCTFLLLFLSCLSVCAQPGEGSLSLGIKKVSGEFFADFKNIKAGIRSDDPYETVYYSRLKLAGSIDSSNLIHFVKESQFWKFTAEMEKGKITPEEMENSILSPIYSFGKLKSISTGIKWTLAYVPENKKGLTGKIRSFVIFVLNGAGNPNDRDGGKLCFTLGQEDSYMNK